ncbi:conserved hypothetical protein [groundwater metagenome]|uniref:Uncharacterized protein n=1 Tax=groundwater metagenome TaxID=717931 RepID=A0A098E960_9ZZZZ
MKIPEWAMKYREKGTEVKDIGGNYYLYEASSKWDPEKKRSKKISGKYLGAITTEGVVKSKHERVLEGLKNISVKEYGATFFLMENNKEIIDVVKKVYPHE